MSSVRTTEQITELLQYAKLDHLCSVGVYQAVNFTPSLDSSQYKLFEMPISLVNELIKPGSQRLVNLKNESNMSNGQVFACTEDRTYSVVEAETSNTLLFASDWTLPSSSDTKENRVEVMQIQAMKNNYFEFKPCVAPSLNLLRKFLLSSTYYGPVEDEIYSETNDEEILYNREFIENRFPCSNIDLSIAFHRLRICELYGKIRPLDCEYLTQLIRDLFAIADENAWDWRNNGFSFQASIDGLKNTHNVDVIKKAIGLFFAQRPSHICPSSQELYMFPRNSKICQVIGEHLLAVTNSFDLVDFLSLWKASVPNGLRPKLRQHLTCAGRAFIQSRFLPRDNCTTKSEKLSLHSRFQSISLLRSEDLPDDTVENRLTALFDRCPIWPEFELASYIEELILSNASDNNYLSLRQVKLQDNSFINISYNDCESDSDFYYEDLVGELIEIDDNPKSVPSNVGVLLNKLCRVSNSSSGRFFTKRHV